MEKISKYAICLPLRDIEDNYVYINGCHGEFVVVPHKIGELICNNLVNNNLEDSRIIGFLRKINYLIPSDFDEEQIITQNCADIKEKQNRYFNFSFIPSYSCNFHCPYCFEKDIATKYPDWLKTNLSYDKIDSIFSFADELVAKGKNFFNVRLFGGEPLLPKNRDIVEYIAKKSLNYDIPIQTITNGYCLDKYIDIVEKYRFDEFKITIDGPADIHDKRRSPSDTHKSFEKILNNVAMVLQYNKKVTLRTNINRENINHIQELIEIYRELGLIQNPNLNYYFKSTISCFEKPENSVSDMEIMEYIGNSIENYSLNSSYFRIYNQIKALIKKNIYLYFKPTYCGANNGNYMFDPKGNIFSCWDNVTEPKSVIGEISGKKVILNEHFKVWQNRMIDRIDKCKECRYKMFCGGGCATQALIVNKDINSSFCDEFAEIFNQIAVAVASRIKKDEVI